MSTRLCVLETLGFILLCVCSLLILTSEVGVIREPLKGIWHLATTAWNIVESPELKDTSLFLLPTTAVGRSYILKIF